MGIRTATALLVVALAPSLLLSGCGDREATRDRSAEVFARAEGSAPPGATVAISETFLEPADGESGTVMPFEPMVRVYLLRYSWAGSPGFHAEVRVTNPDGSHPGTPDASHDAWPMREPPGPGFEEWLGGVLPPGETDARLRVMPVNEAISEFSEYSDEATRVASFRGVPAGRLLWVYVFTAAASPRESVVERREDGSYQTVASTEERREGTGYTHSDGSGHHGYPEDVLDTASWQGEPLASAGTASP